MSQSEIIHRRKHDLYYISVLMAVTFGTIYILMTGTISDARVAFAVRDPVVYLICGFILYACIMLVVNIVRNQRVVLAPQRVIFRTRFRERSIFHDHITRIVLGRERAKLNGGTFAVVKIRTAQRRRWVRIRVANYERERELYQEFKALKQELKK
jgi:hypothetical protein